MKNGVDDQGQAAQGQQQQVPVQPANQVASVDFQSALSAMSGLKVPDSIKKELEQAAQKSAAPAAAPAEPAPGPGGDGSGQQSKGVIDALKEKHQAGPGDDPGAAAEPQVEDSILKTLGLTKPVANEEAPKFIESEEVKSFVKTKFGIEDPKTLFEKSIPEWRKSAQEAAEYKGKVEKIDAIFAKMPEDLYAAFEEWGKGGDYKKVINSRPNIDFSVDAEKADSKLLVDTYLPGQFTQEEWEDYSSQDPNPQTKKAIDLAISQARDKFSFDKNKISDARAEAARQESLRIKAVEESVTRSVANLKSSLPNVADTLVEEVRQELISGNYRSLLHDEKGGYKEDAAYRLMLAKIGPELIRVISSKAASEAKTEARSEFLVGAPEVPPVGSGTPAAGGVSKGVQSFIENVLPKSGQKFY